MRIPHVYNGNRSHVFLCGMGRRAFLAGTGDQQFVPTALNQEGDFSQTVINYNNGKPVYAKIYDPFYGAYNSNPADCTGPLADQYASSGQLLGPPAVSGQ